VKIVKKEDELPMAPRANTPPNLGNIIEYLMANRELLNNEQKASSQDAQKMIDAVEKTRVTINRELDQLIELLRGSMHERMVSVETVIGNKS
jgi:hypothetical protein